MTELRQQIDDLDRELVALLVERAGYIDRAAEIKARDGLPARIDSRIAEVLAQVRQAAATAQLDPDLTETIWRHLIEWSIAREDKRLHDGSGVDAK